MNDLALLTYALQEIDSLRRQNEVLRAKAEVVDAFQLALRADPPRGGAMSPDIVWELRRAIQRREAEQVAPKKAGADDAATAWASAQAEQDASMKVEASNP